MGIPLTPGRAPTRPQATRWQGGASDAFAPRRRALPDPTVAVATCVVVVLLGAVVAGTVPFAPAVGVAALVPAAVTDIEQRRLPDAWVGAAASALMAALAVGWVFGQPSDASMLRGAVAGTIAMTVPVLALHLVSPASMGFGDVKAAAVLGAAIGTVDWRLTPVALCLAALTGVVTAAVTRSRTIAFGPCLVFGAWVVLLLGAHIVGVIFQDAAR